MSRQHLAISLLAVSLASAAAAAPLAFANNQSAGSGNVDVRPVAQVSSEPPDVNGSDTREGVQVTGRSDDADRFNTTGEGRGTKHVPVTHDDNDSRLTGTRDPVVDRPIDDLRIKIRPCGIPTDEMLTGGEVCPAADPPEEDAVRPTPSMAVRRELPRPEDVTWEQVLSETKNIAFPGLRVKVQPAGKTLVNLDTIVYTDQAKVSSTTVTLLGFPVAVEATPMSYLWSFGDGTTVTTESPGKPYPAKEITHKYLKRGSVAVTLTTNYAARFNVAGTGWQYIAGTVPITGPATPLQVQEAVPVLVDPPN